MSPFHQGYVRTLRTTTALQSSCAWLVSENVRLIRLQQEARYWVPVSPSVHKMIENTILLSSVKAKIEEMH